MHPRIRPFSRTSILIVACLSIAIHAFAQADVTISLSAPTLHVGETVVIEAHIDCGASRCGLFALTLQYDPVLLHVERVVLGDYLGDVALGQVIVPENTVDETQGLIRIAAATIGTPLSETGDLLFSIEVTPLAQGTVTFATSRLEVGDLDGQPRDVQLVENFATIADDSSTPMQTTTSTAALQETTVTVRADHGWQSTGVTVSANSAIHFEVVDGEWTTWVDELEMTHGEDYGGACNEADPSVECAEPLPQYSQNALIGRVGSYAFVIGQKNTIIPHEPGMIFLRSNDSLAGMYDNRGELVIRIGVQDVPTAVPPNTRLNIWRVGDPFTEGEIPSATLSESTVDLLNAAGINFEVQVLSGQDFPEAFFYALDHDSEPDILILRNWYSLESYTTENLNITGIMARPGVRETIQSIGDPFPYAPDFAVLVKSSDNYLAARNFVLASLPGCEQLRTFISNGGISDTSQLSDLVITTLHGYVEGNQSELLEFLATNSLIRQMNVEKIRARGGKVLESTICDTAGNEKLALVNAVPTVDGPTYLGLSPQTVALIRESGDWRVLSIAMSFANVRESVSIDDLVAQLRSTTPELPRPATLLEPADGFAYVWTETGLAEQDFVWQPSESNSSAAEIVEFVNASGIFSMLFLVMADEDTERHIERRMLPTNSGEWLWRVWTVGQDGRLMFSETQRFTQ